MRLMGIFGVLYIVGGLLFLVSVAAHVYVRLCLRPRDGGELEEHFHELEDVDPAHLRYNVWLNITFGGAALGVLLVFLVFVI